MAQAHRRLVPKKVDPNSKESVEGSEGAVGSEDKIGSGTQTYRAEWNLT